MARRCLGASLSRQKFGLTLAGLLLLARGPAQGGQLRYHFTPIDGNGTTALQSSEVSGPRLDMLGGRGSTLGPPPGTTYLMTYWLPYSSRRVTIPVTFPEGTPNIEHARNRVIYNYGSYYVQVRFQADGSVDVIYSTGFLRGW